MTRYLIPFVAAAIVAGCAAPRPSGPVAPAVTSRPAEYTPPEIRLYAFERRVTSTRPEIALAPPSPDLPSTVPPGTAIGTVQPRPARLSERHHDAIVTAERLYGAGQFREALDLLQPAYYDEPQNPFVAEPYAKTLYRAGLRESAFAVYERLIDGTDRRMAAQLRARNPGAMPGVLVDAWLIDAYWKKGTLHLDRGEWDKAAFEISRAYYQMRDARLVDQALSYLTEAFFNLGQLDIAGYYGNATLRHNPNNTYVLPFMADIRRKAAPRTP